MSKSAPPPSKIIQTNSEIGDPGNIHIYYPDQTPQKCYPFIFLIHGGGWYAGDQKTYASLAQRFLSLGVAVVLPSHRKAPEFPFPCAYEDLLHVLRWIEKNGESVHLDSKRFMLLGTSAGAHLGMLIATRGTRENEYLQSHLLGAACFWGIMDLRDQFEWDKKLESSMTINFIGSTPEEYPEAYRLASPIDQIHANVPPIWMVHGVKDPVVHVEQSRKMVERFKQHGIHPVYLENPVGGHAFGTQKVENPNEIIFQKELFNFIKDVLKL